MGTILLSQQTKKKLKLEMNIHLSEKIRNKRKVVIPKIKTVIHYHQKKE